MSDTSYEALLAWCERQRERDLNAAVAYNNPRFLDDAAKWEALAALVRAQEALRAEIEKLRKSTRVTGWLRATLATTYNDALDDVLRLLPARGEK